MNNKKDSKGTCMACSCPCDAHKEHNHPIEGENKGGAKTCQMCGHEHKSGGACDCGCK